MTRALFAATLGITLVLGACGPRGVQERAARTAASPLSASSYRIIGRADLRDPSAPVLAWPGTTISLTAEGPELRAHVREHRAMFGTSIYQAFVDGKEVPQPLALVEGESTVLVAKLGEGPHRVDLVKRTEASAGTTTFLGFEGATLLAPPAPRARTLEIVGDSNTAAYGVDGAGPACHFTPETENFLHGYAWKLGQALHADVTATAFSGKGVLQNYAREDKATLGALYPLSNPLDPTSAAAPPRADAVLVFAGGNDYAQPTPGTFDKPDDRAFALAYLELLKKIRAAHPAVPIVCVVTPAVEDLWPEGYFARSSLETNIRAAILLSGDTSTFFLAPTQAEKSELTGCDYHPSPGLHERLAMTIAPMIEHATYSTRHMP